MTPEGPTRPELGLRLRSFTAAYAANKWPAAERALRSMLRLAPTDHWLLSRLSSVLYEQRRYREAVSAARSALRIMPTCPLARWDYAGALDMSGRTAEALRVWKRILRRGVDRIASDPCSEGRQWSEALCNDVRYSIGIVYARQQRRRLARHWLRAYLQNRDRGVRSIYRLADARRRLEVISQGRK